MSEQETTRFFLLLHYWVIQILKLEVDSWATSFVFDQRYFHEAHFQDFFLWENWLTHSNSLLEKVCSMLLSRKTHNKSLIFLFGRNLFLLPRLRIMSIRNKNSDLHIRGKQINFPWPFCFVSCLFRNL